MQQQQTHTTTSDMSTDSRTPLMSWSQTANCLTIVVSLRTSCEIQSSVAFTASALDLRVVVDGESTPYEMKATWFANVVADECTWKRLGNGDLLLTMAKENEEEWSHPFANRAYKGFVRIDWSRWADVDCSDDDDGDDNDDHFDLSNLSSASAGDFGGVGDAGFPSESNPEFQDMMSGLEKLGRDTDVKLPDLDALKNMNSDQLRELLKNTSVGTSVDNVGGCSELDLNKMQACLNEEDVDDEENGKQSSDTDNDATSAEANTTTTSHKHE